MIPPPVPPSAPQAASEPSQDHLLGAAASSAVPSPNASSLHVDTLSAFPPLPPSQSASGLSRNSWWSLTSAAPSEGASVRGMISGPSSTGGFVGSSIDPRAGSSSNLVSPQSQRSDGTFTPINFQTPFTPHAGMILYPNEVEADDEIHNPAVGEKDRFDVFTKRGILNLGGLLFIMGLLFTTFIAYPIYLVAKSSLNTKNVNVVLQNLCPQLGANCADVQAAKSLENHRRGLIDPDTPKGAFSKKSSSGKDWVLVFSDEFNLDNRSFYPGDDPYWEAVDIHYAATMDLQWYDPDAVTTRNGHLEIEFEKYNNHDLSYRSGMLQSWNKLCFKGGIIEASVSLPGKEDVPGFWGAFWTMGNLGRPGYLASTEGLWPYSYNDKCDGGVAKNQSSTNGLSWLPGMKLPGCTCKGQDHPNPGTARGAPEIDVFEANSEETKGKYKGYISQSSQVAPFDKDYKPDYNYVNVYENNMTMINTYLGGNLQQSISGLTKLEAEWFQNMDGFQTYGFEYKPGTDGHVEFFVGDTKTIRVDGKATGPRHGIGARPVSNEPMSIIFNVGMSPSFSEIDFAKIEKILPGKLRVDWIRIYQDPDNIMVTCDPPGYETTQYIKEHPEPYDNANLTRWEQTKYEWPKNSFSDKCSV